MRRGEEAFQAPTGSSVSLDVSNTNGAHMITASVLANSDVVATINSVNRFHLAGWLGGTPAEKVESE